MAMLGTEPGSGGSHCQKFEGEEGEDGGRAKRYQSPVTVTGTPKLLPGLCANIIQKFSPAVTIFSPSPSILVGKGETNEGYLHR